MPKKFWLMKTEPDVFSIDDLKNAADATDRWEGVRNYQARNFMRDQMKKGDEVLFYHSNAEPSGVVGVAVVTKEAYPDPTALDPNSKYFDEKSAQLGESRWLMVDVSFKFKFQRTVTLKAIKEHPKLNTMRVAQKGQRLSIQPVLKEEFQEVKKLGGLAKDSF